MKSLWNSTRMVLLFVALLFVFAFPSCKRFQSATRDECQLAVSHILKINARGDTGKTGYGIAARLTAIGGKILAMATGDYDEAVAKCVLNCNKADIVCILNANTKEELKKCN